MLNQKNNAYYFEHFNLSFLYSDQNILYAFYPNFALKVNNFHGIGQLNKRLSLSLALSLTNLLEVLLRLCHVGVLHEFFNMRNHLSERN